MRGKGAVAYGHTARTTSRQSSAHPSPLDILANQIGNLSHVAVVGEIEARDVDGARGILERYGVPW